MGGTWTQVYWVFKFVPLGACLTLYHRHLHVVPDAPSSVASFTAFCLSLTFLTLWVRSTFFAFKVLCFLAAVGVCLCTVLIVTDVANTITLQRMAGTLPYRC